MTQKVRKVLIMVVMAALILCLMAASLTYTFTYGRYAGNDFNADDSPYDDLIEFVGSREYTVRTPEELIQAIEDGYSNIQIAVDAEEPFVITEGVTDVSANLVLDLNGKVVVRNSRNPLLDVQTNVSVVLVYDSSKEGQGAFYNPVGSSLQASGGTLTVGSGNYEDGPRAEEYGNVSSAVTLGTQPADVTIYTRNGITDPSSVDRAVQTSYTKIEDPQNLVPATTGRYYQPETSNSAYTLVPADTFLIYTEEENCFIGDDTPLNGVTFVKDQLYVDAEREGDVISASEFISPECNVASCDFYYYYPIDENGSPINTPGTADTPQDYAVIYGYWDVMALAEKEDKSLTSGNDTNLIWPYAAVRMVNGEGFVRGGNFKNNFNAVNTYGIYATDGRLAVSQVPVTSGSITTNFTTGGDGVCIRVSSSAGSTTGGDEGGGTLDISGGSFSSEIGNTIEMQGGTMNVTAGTFTKNAAVEGADSGEGANNGSAIDITGGTLNMTGTEANDVKSVSFDIKGNYVNGIKMEKEESATADPDTIKNAAFSFNKESGQGSGGTSVAAIQVLNGSLNVSDSTFDFNQGYAGTAYTNNGIYVQGGSVEAENCTFTLSPDGSVTGSAAIASVGGTVTASGSTFTVNGNNNYGIYSSITEEGAGEGEYDTTATDCTFTMKGNQNHGIYAAGGKTLASGGTYTIGSENGSGQTANFGIQVSSGSVALAGVTLDVYGEKSSCVYAVGGTISLSGENAVNMHFSSTGTTISSTAISTEGGAIEVTGGSTSVSSNALGITARQNDGNEGSISIANGAAVTVGAENSPLHVTGVYVNGGKIENKGTLTVFSTIKDDLSWNETNKYNGVFVNGGSLVSNGTLNVTFTGVENEARNVSGNDQIVYNGENTSFLNQQTKSYAVRVEAGTGTNTNVTIDSGNITNTVGGGVLVNGGKVTLGTTGEGAYNESTKRGLTVQTTGTEVNTSLIYINGMADNWAYYWNMKGGDAVKVDGGDLYVYGGKYTAAQGNGILTRGGTANIFNGIFTGGYNSNYHATTGAASTYSFKAYGGTVKISGGDFNSEAEGAFVMGTSDDDKVTITGGSFQADGPTAFATWNGATVEFDDTNSENKITVSGESTGLTVEQVSSGWRSQNITIKSATFKSTNQNQSNKNGIWYGNGNAKLTISGGSFTGTTGSGLSIGETPNYDWNTRTHNIQLSGGSFKGGWNAPISNYSSNYLVSGAWTSGNNTSGQTFYIYS